MRKRKPVGSMLAVFFVLLASGAGGAAAGDESKCDLPSEGPAGAGKYRYVLSKDATALYPQTPAAGTQQASVFPYYYEQFYPDLGGTIAHFTGLSLQRGGAGTKAEARVVCDQAVITLEGAGDLAGFAVPWVAANHPDVTSYNCCAGDKSEECKNSTDLVQDELKDLVTYCAIQKVAEGTAPQVALDACATTWCLNTYPECPAATKREICIRLRLDYSYNSKNSQCKCRPAAEAFCQQYQNDGCPNKGAQTSCKEFNEKSCSDTKQSWVDCPKS